MAEFNEAHLYEALGVAPEGEGEQAPEQTVPDARERDTPEAEGETAQEDNTAGASAEAPESGGDTAERVRPENEHGEASEEDGETADGKPSGEQTPEQRRENAARRRKEEQKAAIDRAVSEALAREKERYEKEWSAFFEKANLKNTVNGQPITTREEFDAWSREFEAEKLRRELKEGKLTPEALKQVVSDAPEMRRVKELLEREENARRESAAAAERKQIEAELAEIHRLDPSVSTVEDLLRMPAAREFYAYVRRGNTFADAFYLANRERLAAEAAEAAKRQAVSAARSKDHLQPAGASRGAGADSVPKEEMELFRLLLPDAPEAEIQKYYNRSRQG